MLYITAGLTELHEITFISSFLCLLIAKDHMGKLNSYQLTLLPKQTNTNTHLLQAL